MQGLFDKKRKGRPPKLKKEKESFLVKRIQSGVTSQDPVSVLKGRYIKKILKTEFKTKYSLSGVYDLLRRLNFKRIKPRPCHEKNDKKLMAQWVEITLPNKVDEIKSSFPNKKIQLWFQDEMRFGEKTKISSEWKLSGTAWSQVKQTGYRNCYIFGAVTPDSGERVGVIFPKCDSEAMNIHLSLISKELKENVQALLILDQAGWHASSQKLKVPNNITLLNLPAYSPELNPVERLWLWLKENYLANLFISKKDDLTKIGCRIWNQLDSKRVKSICKISFTNFS